MELPNGGFLVKGKLKAHNHADDFSSFNNSVHEAPSLLIPEDKQYEILVSNTIIFEFSGDFFEKNFIQKMKKMSRIQSEIRSSEPLLKKKKSFVMYSNKQEKLNKVANKVENDKYVSFFNN